MNRKTLKDDGFTGFRPIKSLEINRIPQRQGMFAVVRPEGFEPRFLSKSTAGVFKRRNPSLSQADLAAEWVADADILFFGKAGSGSKGNRGLRRQISEFIDFGNGKPPGHWDGRLIWQLADAGNLLVAWKELPLDALNAALSDCQSDFRRQYGSLPFANLVQARA
ncbi:hypothetical protein [Arthrobacter yangruifuii]|uniref:hypothetical protein n=1 Tax=Arthrobacter yangruifuii TaxID=2606616 RepID=UPI0011B6915F|nr:hypothetical protein [Arthrobacter yangruifuii]